MWANELDVPIFMVDYRLAPKYPYPDPPNDCYQAYVWLVTHAKEQLGMDINKFVLAGDSAGGHLVMQVPNLCMLRGFRKPDGLLCIYPSLTFDLEYFLPSSMLMCDDPILNANIILLIKACIVRREESGDPMTNPMMSPLITPPEMLRLLPPT